MPRSGPCMGTAGTKKLRGTPPRNILRQTGFPLFRPRLAALPSVSQLRPVRGPAAIRQRQRHRYSHFLNLKNQKVKHEMKIIRTSAKI